MAKKGGILEKAFTTWRAPPLRGVEVQDSTWGEWEKAVEESGAAHLNTELDALEEDPPNPPGTTPPPPKPR